MARVCEITGVRPMVGNNVSHSNRKTKRRFLPNLQKRRLWSEETGYVTVRITRKGLKLIDKIGLKAALAKIAPLEK